MKKIKVLQVGEKDWSTEQKNYNKFEYLDWFFINSKEMSNFFEEKEKVNAQKKVYDVVIFSDYFDKKYYDKLSPFIEAHSLILDKKLGFDYINIINKQKIPFYMDFNDHVDVITTIKKNFFSGQMGSKLNINTISVSDKFYGEKELFGQDHLKLNGEYFGYSSDLLSWKMNISMNKRDKKIWLEFNHDENVQVELKITKILDGTSEIIGYDEYDEYQINEGIEIPYKEKVGYLYIELRAEGTGILNVGALHFRDSRNIYGEYLLGGEKVSDKKNQELFYYFNPGDLKPPLNVYFSGYRSAEGFEGFYMMKSLGAPFLLITDPRLEGGSFYMGTSELENKLVDVIKSTLKTLNFTNKELILSGLSMGTYGSLYYASDLRPKYIIVGKPLINIGTVASNEKLIRPGGFPTSLDILRSISGDLSKNSIENLNLRFWSKFVNGNFDESTFIIAYMKNDDYDGEAFPMLKDYLSETGASIIGKGILGRHNDNSPAINQWFIGQYKRILFDSFGRRR